MWVLFCCLTLVKLPLCLAYRKGFFPENVHLGVNRIDEYYNRLDTKQSIPPNIKLDIKPSYKFVLKYFSHFGLIGVNV
jgi:hypothetical protein